jgi:hypothetical protein
MLNPLRLTACLGVMLALVASGCGSTKTTSTSASVTAPANPTPQTASPASPSQTTSPSHTTGPSQTTGHQGATSKRGVVVSPQVVRKVLKEHHIVLKRSPPSKAGEKRPAIETEGRHHISAEIETTFLAACTAAKGSPSNCECIFTTAEKSNAEKGESIAELLGLEVAFKGGLTTGRPATLEEILRHTVKAPQRIRGFAEACARNSKA